jgi:hypothetical protein
MFLLTVYILATYCSYEILLVFQLWYFTHSDPSIFSVMFLRSVFILATYCSNYIYTDY